MEPYQLSREKRYEQRVKFDFPDYKLTVQYQGASKAGCIVYPLYAAFEGVYPESHINSACWSAHSFWVNSDVINQNIPIYFYVEDNIFEDAYKQLTSYKIPDSMILKYRVPNRSPRWGGQFISQSLYIVLDSFFEQYEHVVIPDTDLFLSTRHSEKLFDVSNLWEREDISRYASYDINKGRLRDPKWDKYYELPVEHGAELFKSLCEEHLGMETNKVHHILAVINSFSPKFLDSRFREFVDKYVHLFGSEEDALSLYMQWSGNEVEDLGDTWKMSVANYLEQFNEHYDNSNFFFSHLRPAKLPTSNSLHRFEYSIGLHKEVLP